MAEGEVSKTTIQISDSLRRNIKVLASYRDVSYEDILEDFTELFASLIPFKNEREFASWFEKNLMFFGFNRILEKGRGFPDYVVEDMKGNKKRVELEILAKDFARHRHDPSKVDFVVCVHSKENRIMGVPVLSVVDVPFREGELVGRRQRVSLTLDEDLLGLLDEHVAKSGERSRSAALENILKNAIEANRTCVILAGGDPSRLYMKELKTYRPFVDVGGHTLIEELISKVVSDGYSNVIIVGSRPIIHRMNILLKSGAKYGAKITYIEEQRPLGTAKTLELARKYIKGDFLFLPCDVYFDFDLRKMEQLHKKLGGHITLGVHTRTSFSWKAGVVQMDGHNIIDFEESPEKPKTRLFSTFVGFISPEIFSEIPPGNVNYSIQEDILPKLAKEGKLIGYPIAGDWVNVHSKTDVENVLRLKKQK